MRLHASNHVWLEPGAIQSAATVRTILGRRQVYDTVESAPPDWPTQVSIPISLLGIRDDQSLLGTSVGTTCIDRSKTWRFAQILELSGPVMSSYQRALGDWCLAAPHGLVRTYVVDSSYDRWFRVATSSTSPLGAGGVGSTVAPGGSMRDELRLFEAPYCP